MTPTPQAGEAAKLEALIHAYADAKLIRYGLLHDTKTRAKHDPGVAFKAVQEALRVALAAPTQVQEAATAKEDGIVLSVKRSEWEALSPEAQAKLESIVWKGARAYRQQQAEGRERIINTPLLAAPTESQGAAPVEAPACQGANCGTTNGTHSAECFAETEAAFVKLGMGSATESWSGA